MRLIFIAISVTLMSLSFLKIEKGVASYYGDSLNGRRTYSGEIFNNSLMTAAHKTLPMGTYVKVTNLKNDSVVVVKINDRMPKSNPRVIDLSKAAAKKLNFVRAGLTTVTVETIDKPE
jgi:rare lipoprotein A